MKEAKKTARTLPGEINGTEKNVWPTKHRGRHHPKSISSGALPGEQHGPISSPTIIRSFQIPMDILSSVDRILERGLSALDKEMTVLEKKAGTEEMTTPDRKMLLAYVDTLSKYKRLELAAQQLEKQNAEKMSPEEALLYVKTKLGLNEGPASEMILGSLGSGEPAETLDETEES